MEKCPNVTGVETWGYIATKTCVALCFDNTWGDNSTGKRLCVSQCPSLPMRWSYDGPGGVKNVNLCMNPCPSPYFG